MLNNLRYSILEHFGLQEIPFGLTPDTQFFCHLNSHQKALNVLLIALHNGEGFIKITGPVGSGKTMLCRKLLNQLDEDFVTAYLPNPHLSPSSLRQAVADELGIRHGKNLQQNQLLQKINSHLIQSARAGRQTVLLIDEAQAMSRQTLEALRLLTNLETEKQKLLQIVLFGQPELDDLLRDKSIRQLRQRITFSYQLKPLSNREVGHYLQHRLHIAGSGREPIFTRAAGAALYYYSHGIPRLINILAHKAMLSAYGTGTRHIHCKQVQLAASDTDETRKMLPVFAVSTWTTGLALLSAVTIIIWRLLQV